MRDGDILPKTSGPFLQFEDVTSLNHNDDGSARKHFKESGGIINTVAVKVSVFRGCIYIYILYLCALSIASAITGHGWFNRSK